MKYFTKAAAVWTLTAALPWIVGCQQATVAGPQIRELIRQAGNTENDARRLTLLRQIREMKDLDTDLRRDADRLVAVADQWTTSKYLFSFAEQGDTGLLAPLVDSRSPFYPLACFYRGRMLTWRVLEGASGARRTLLLDTARADFERSQTAFPDNRISGMYLGHPVQWDRELPGTEQAPEWAALQRECLERLADIVTWWIDHRQQADGQFGGSWGDDCEMWRWWVPVLIAFEDPRMVQAQERFCDGMMGQPRMQGGYTSRMHDVQHTAEESSDVITPMLHLKPEDVLWEARALRLIERMATVWAGRNERGQLQFKSTYFRYDAVDESPLRACDTVYHARAMQPAMLLWLHSGDRRLAPLLSAWMDTWVDAAARSERGKPPGVMPSAIHWPEGHVGGLDEPWWDPRNYRFPELYRWPSALSAMADTLLLTHRMTGDDKYLTPLRSMAALRLRWLKHRPERPARPGSESWCSESLGLLAPTLAKYKLLTGSREFDELLALEKFHALVFDSNSREMDLGGLRETADALRVNFAGYTSEVRYTDRVLKVPTLFQRSTPNTTLLYSLATGDPGSIRYFPLYAVRWLTPPRDIAARVTAANKQHFAAELYHFGTEDRPFQAELHLLATGQYTVSLMTPAGGLVSPPLPLAVTGPRPRIRLVLPPRTLCILKIELISS